MQENVVSSTLKFVATGLVGDLFYFPIWWYSVGLKERWQGLWRGVKDAERRLALVIWLKNMFVPMYGYYDWLSRLISFVMRLVMLVFKLAVFVFWLVIYLAGFLIYFLLPIFVAIMLVRSFS